MKPDSTGLAPNHGTKPLIVGVCWFCWAASLTHSISELCSDCPDKCPVSQLHNCSICHDPHNAFDEKLKEHHNALKNKVWTQTESLNTGTVSTARVRCNQRSLVFTQLACFFLQREQLNHSETVIAGHDSGNQPLK